MAVVLITGCSSGIGLETALAFSRRGDRVYATMRDPLRGDRLQQAAEQKGLAVTVAALDVTDGTAILHVVADIVDREGRIDVLVNNAGVSGAASSIEEIDENVARAVWETNFWAPLRLIRAVLPHMRAQHSGVIANLSTFGARLPGARVLAMYAISKHAISRLSESLQAELTGTGVRVVAIEPGFFATDIYNDQKRSVIDPSSPYATMVATIDEAIATGIAEGADPALVAQAIVASVDDPNTPVCVLVGDDTIERVGAYRQELITAWQTEPRAVEDDSVDAPAPPAVADPK